MSEPLNEYKWGELLDIIKTPVDMKDEDVFPLASIRRRNGGFFHRETKLGKDILTKTLSKAAPGAFAISRMQVVHGACSYVSERFSDAFLSASYTQFQAKSPPKIDTKYLHYYSHTNESYNAFLMSSHGVHIEKMTFDLKDWLRRKVKLPPLPEQKKIASIFTSVDEVIENTSRQIDKLQDLKKATMNELLTKGIGHTEFKDSELGRIPKSWDIKSLGEIGLFKNGLNKPKESFGFGTKFVNISDAYPINLDCDTLGRLDASKKEITDCFLQAGDLIFVRSSVKLGGVAIPTEFHHYDEPVVFCGFMIRFRPIIKSLNSSYLRQYLLNEEVRIRIEQLATGGANININQESLSKFKILLPTTEEQQYFSTVNQEFEKSIENHRQKLQKTQSLKKSLMQDLLTGKVRVTVN